ncbi:MAG: BrnT family toxin [Paraglaciecola sp.]|nr:BrnT family toxin [Paraglaciecola sp.]
MSVTNSEWDEAKNLYNQESHGVSFTEAQYAFLDERRVIAEDVAHSKDEERYFCLGLNKDQTGILTVRFTYRSGRIRIIGAGYWRKGKKAYEESNSVH